MEFEWDENKNQSNQIKHNIRLALKKLQKFSAIQRTKLLILVKTMVRLDILGLEEIIKW